MPISSARTCPVLIERETELAVLDGLLVDAAAGQGRTALLIGEAGIGKSRLANEVIFRATRRGFWTLEGRCLESDRDLPFAPFVDASHQHTTLPLPTPDTPTVGFPIVPPGSNVDVDLDNVAPTRSSVPGKRQVFEDIVAYLRKLSTEQPLLVVLEDLHWSDPTSLELLSILPRRLAGSRALILGTMRPDPGNRDLQQWFASAHRARTAVEIAVPQLSEAAVSQMAAELLSSPPSTALGSAVRQRTDGNPFFVEELLAIAPATDRLDWLLGNPDVPKRVQDAILLHIETLPDFARRVIDFAAVAGQEVDYDLLVAGVDLPQGDVLAALRLLIDRELLVETRLPGSSRFAFRHALMRDSIRSRLLGPELRALHQMIAETRAGSLGEEEPAIEVAGELGYHFHAAGIWERTLPYAGRASDAAWQIGATVEALSHGRRALDAAVELDDPHAAELHRRCGEACSVLGLFDDALEHLEEAVSLARLRQLVDEELAAVDDLASLYASRDYATARRYAEAAVKLAQEAGTPRHQAVALNRLGNVLTNLGLFDEGRGMHEAALDACTSQGDRWGIADSWDLIGMARYLAGEIPEARHAFTHAIAIFAELGDRQRVASARTSRGMYLAALEGICATDASPAACREDAAEGLRICQQISWRAGEAYAMVALACADLGEGQVTDAQQRAELALAIAEEIDHKQWQVIALVTLGLIAIEIHDHDAALARLESGRETATAVQATQWLERIEALLSGLQPMDEFAPSHPNPTAPVLRPTSIGQRQTCAVRCEHELAAGNHDRALALADVLLFGGTHPQSAAALLLRSRVLAAMGRTVDADAGFLDARRRAEEAGPRFLLWRIAAARSTMWQPLDPSLARQEASTARAALERFASTVPDEQRAAFLEHPMVRPWAGDANRQRRSRGTDVSALTPRECDVARLVAQGLSNKELARALGISEKTIEMHVSNCLGKLGFTSRAQIAAWTVSAGLGSTLARQG